MIRTAAVLLCAAALGCGGGSGGADASDHGFGWDATTSLPVCADTIVPSINNAQAPGAGSMGYVPPSAQQLASLRESLAEMPSGTGVVALRAAADAGYELCHQLPLIMWRPLDQSTGRATIVWRDDHDAKPLIVGAPHAEFETNTLAEAKLMFEQLNARVLIVSGTHRCANATTTTCSGTSSVCGASGPYRQSDMAHVVESTYQGAHEWFAQQFGSDLVISLHGMSAAGASISNGTTNPVADDSPVARFATELSAQFPAENITTCNAYTGASVDERLCGTTNAQGRFVNNSANACTTSAVGANDRFIHLEQSLDLRAERQKVVVALENVLQ